VPPENCLAKKSLKNVSEILLKFCQALKNEDYQLPETLGIAEGRIFNECSARNYR
jgi:hypothetical protein